MPPFHVTGGARDEFVKMNHLTSDGQMTRSSITTGVIGVTGAVASYDA